LYNEMRYEALVSEPAKECEELYSFLDLSYDDVMLRFHEGREKVRPGRGAKSAWLRITSGLRDWRTEKPEAEVERFEAAAGDVLKLDYERAFLNPSSDAPEHAARIQEAFAQELLAGGDRPPGS
jgi:hypothetical protein